MSNNLEASQVNIHFFFYYLSSSTLKLLMINVEYTKMYYVFRQHFIKYYIIIGREKEKS